MGCLKFCKEQMTESGFEPGSEDKVEGPNHQARPPSAHQVESPRCLILWAVSPIKDAWRRDGANVRTMALEGTEQLTFHGHPQDGEAKRPRFWYKSSHLGGGALPDKAPLFSFPQARGLYSGTLHFTCRMPSVSRGLCMSRVLPGIMVRQE